VKTRCKPPGGRCTWCKGVNQLQIRCKSGVNWQVYLARRALQAGGWLLVVVVEGVGDADRLASRVRSWLCRARGLGLRSYVFLPGDDEARCAQARWSNTGQNTGQILDYPGLRVPARGRRGAVRSSTLVKALVKHGQILDYPGLCVLARGRRGAVRSSASQTRGKTPVNHRPRLARPPHGNQSFGGFKARTSGGNRSIGRRSLHRDSRGCAHATPAPRWVNA
jgi:hypothetical protein